MPGALQIKLTKVPKIQLSDYVLERVLERVGYKYLNQVERRNKQGISVNGSKYLPYTAEYAVLKGQRAGWLQLSGAMMASRQVNVKNKRMKITISGTRPTASITKTGALHTGNSQVSNAVVAFGNNKYRQFMGVNAKEEKALAVFMKREIIRELKKNKK